MTKISEIISLFENAIPLMLQESYDNCGIQCGNKENEVSGVLLTLDVTENTIDEAIEQNLNLIICHHPVIFSGLKKITGKTYTERVIIKAIKNDICIYAVHTNLDNLHFGVNKIIGEKLGLSNLKILQPKNSGLNKLVVFTPKTQAEQVRNAMFNAGAGHIGNYSHCSFNTAGEGSFNANEKANPFVGSKSKLHFEDEIKTEVIVPEHLLNNVISEMQKNHPYEEVAYDIFPLLNKNPQIGAGMVGEYENPISETTFMQILCRNFNVPVARHTELLRKPVKKVAFCGGSGSFLLSSAIVHGADVFMSSDFKYHQFFDANGKILIVDIGHFENEQFTTEIFFSILKENFSNFAIHFSKVITNPVNYYIHE